MTGWWETQYRGGGPAQVKGFPRPCIIGPRIAVNGYARFPSGKRGVYLYAHRVIWEQAHGPIPEGHHVHHACGTRACINLEHLELFTKSEHHSLHSRKCDHDDRDPGGTCRICEREWRREYERRRYQTDPVYRAKKIARATAFKRRKRGEVLRDGSLA